MTDDFLTSDEVIAGWKRQDRESDRGPGIIVEAYGCAPRFIPDGQYEVVAIVRLSGVDDPEAA